MKWSEIIREAPEEPMDFSRSGKFWYNGKTGDAYRVRGHHTLAAFDIPALAQVLKTALGDDYETFVATTRRAAAAFFRAADTQPNDPYLTLHDQVCDILCNAGFIRGINELVFYLALTSRFERACRELVAMCAPRIVQFDLIDLQKSGKIEGAEVEVFVRGRSLKAFVV